MKYDLNAKIFYLFFIDVLKEYYKKNVKDVDIDLYIKDIHQEYKAMIKRTEGIGGKSNYLEPNLIMACCFFSMAKIIPGFNPKYLDDIIDIAFHRDLMVNMNKTKKKSGALFSQKEYQARLIDAKKSKTSTYENDWVYDFKPGENQFETTYYKCGICTLAKKEHMDEYVKCLCKSDYINYELMGGKLIRTKTLANGDECCDFHVERIE